MLELLPLGSLFDLLHTRHQHLQWLEKVQLLHDIACGMTYLHTMGHCHRDLKSGNVLISGSDASQLRAKISDLGTIRNLNVGSASTPKQLADTSNLDLNLTRAGFGTPMYMAPEVLARHGHYGFPCDVYSYGCLSWELLHERLPDLLLETEHSLNGPLIVRLNSLLKTGVTLPIDTTLGLPEWTMQLVRRCLAYKPEGRPDFAACLELYSQALRANVPAI